MNGGYPCSREGEEQGCENKCGEGVVTCTSGFWSECVVPKRDTPCENACGKGVEICENNEQGACVVPDATLACENDCGPGEQRCESGVLKECVVPSVTRECTSKCGVGSETCVDNAWGVCSAPQPLPPILKGIVRDFLESHPDFEYEMTGAETGIVQYFLGADGKPVYAGGPTGTVTTHGKSDFDEWFRDVPGVNQSMPFELPLVVSPSDPRLYLYTNNAFFPVDNVLFGNEGMEHNFFFTFEASGNFVYQGGERFTFTGDDDVFVFINSRLAIDLGGTHQSLSATIDLDASAVELGIELGGKYPLHLFFAERHTVASNFVIETSISDLGECPP